MYEAHGEGLLWGFLLTLVLGRRFLSVPSPGGFEGC